MFTFQKCILHNMLLFQVLLLVSSLTTVTSTLYGLNLEANSPSRVGLVSVNTSTGNVTDLGAPHSELDGMGDLSTIDPQNKIFYYLGDTSDGTTLVGLNLETGAEVCRGAIPLRELGFVGFGQSLDWDVTNNNLVLSGLNSNTTQPGHTVFRNKGCEGSKIAKSSKIGTFGDAMYIPMLHASTLDVIKQRLFVTVAVTKNTMGIGMIDLNDPQLKLTVLPENPATNQDILGMQFDAATNSVVSVMQNQAKGLDIHSLSIDAKGKAEWSSTTLPTFIGQLYGNSGSVSALDGKGMLYVLGGVGPSNNAPMHLVQIDLVKQTVVGHPLITGTCMDCLMELNYV